MNKSRHVLMAGPKRFTLRKVLWGLGFLALLVWAIKNPSQAGGAVHTLAHSVSVFASGVGGRG